MTQIELRESSLWSTTAFPLPAFVCGQKQQKSGINRNVEKPKKDWIPGTFALDSVLASGKRLVIESSRRRIPLERGDITTKIDCCKF
jgi:hypothetical protein